mgnify:CR=1 FL=1
MLQINNVSKSFGNERVLKNLSLSLVPGRTLSILGRSGSGKTTLLKAIAGLITLDEGDIIWNGTLMNDVKPSEREMIYLYQESLLFPHFNVFQNIAFGLRIRKVDEQEREHKVNDMIERLGLGGMAQKMPHQLSGGQKQRVSFGRALVVNPRLLLLDEPFGNLDVTTRERMQELFKKISGEMGITAIFVTHNLKEAILMGNAIAHMQNGSLKTFESTEEFIKSHETGVQDEIAFWQQLSDQQ